MTTRRIAYCVKCHRQRAIHAKGLCEPCYQYPRYSAWKKEHLAQHEANQWRSHLHRKYNITPEQYDAMLLAQGGVCAICHTPPKKNRLSVDHDHTTMRVRGLLCPTCNRFMLHMINHAETARAYLAKVTT